MNKKAVIFGAGSIGRGFVGELMSLSSYDITLVDVNQELIGKLVQKGNYTLKLISNKQTLEKSIPVQNTINGSNEKEVALAVKDTDIIFTAVGQNALKYIARPIAKGVEQRETPINIILCENMMDADTAFSNMVRSHLDNEETINRAGFIRASVGRMVPLPEPDEDILVVKAEPYYHLPIDADGIVGELPEFRGCEKVSPFDFAMERKLFIHNLGHVTCAWLGVQKGYTYIYQAVEDTEIKNIVSLAMNEAALGLWVKYNKDKKELNNHINDLLSRFANRGLGDTVARVGRDTLRKLGANDRVVGALKLCKQYNLPHDTISRVLSAGLAFKNDDEGTNRLQELINNKGVDIVLEEVCKINE